MEICIKNIVDNKDISLSTIKTYTSFIKNLFTKSTGKGISDFDLDAFKNVDDIMNVMKDTSDKNKKTKIASIIVALESNDKDKYKDTIKKYRDIVSKINDELKKTEFNQEMTEKQKENFVEWKDVLSLYNNMKKKYVKDFSNYSEKELLPFIVLSLYTQIPPRRLTDFILMKHRDYDEKDNYFIPVGSRSGAPKKGNKKGKFVFNQYKTSKIYGTQTVEIPNELNKILIDWIQKIGSKSEFLLGEEMSNVKLNGILNNIFGKKVGASILRSSYLSNMYKDVPKLKELQQVAMEMGHSVGEAMKEYVKK